MPTGAAVHIVTGIPFPSTTFNASTSTFTLAGSTDYTNIFAPNYLMTVTGTSTSNDGYYQVLSSTYTGGHTVVTVESYSTGTAFPGTVPFVSSGSGTVIWFNVTGSGFVSPWVQVDGGVMTAPGEYPQYSAVLSTSNATTITAIGTVVYTTNGGTSWTDIAGPSFPNMTNIFSMQGGNDTLILMAGTYAPLFEIDMTVAGDGVTTTINSVVSGAPATGIILTGGGLSTTPGFSSGSTGATWTLNTAVTPGTYNGVVGSYNGGLIGRSTDNGVTWTDITPAQITSTPYTGGLGTLVGGSGGTDGVYGPIIPTTSGSGQSANMTVTVSGGTVVSVDLSGGFGWGYAPGDTLTAPSADIGNVTGFQVTINQCYAQYSYAVTQPYYSNTASAWLMFSAYANPNYPPMSAWRSTDNGTTWTNIATPVVFQSSSFNQQSFLDLSSNILVAGADHTAAAVLQSTDGGLTWTEVLMDTNAGLFQTLAKNGSIINVIGPNSGYALAYSYTSTTGNSGDWTLQSNGTDATTVPPYFSSQIAIGSNFVSGFNISTGSVGYSSAGVTWTDEPSTAGHGGIGLATDSSRAYDYGAGIYSSTDGTTWTLELNPATITIVNSIQTLSTLDLAFGTDLAGNGAIWKRT
jgi:hypothetical protein